MQKSFWLHVAVLGLATGLTFSQEALAQGVPAERPPSSFTGDQFVDSRGCVFVRVGVGSATEWVPRVGRDRNQICGQTPSGVSGAGAPDLASTSGVTVIGPVPGSPPAAPAPAAPRTAAAPAAPAPRVSAPIVVQAPVAAAPQVRAITPAPAAPVTIQAPSGATGCPNLPASAQPYFTGENVRCGPQAVHPGVGPQSNLGGAASGNAGGGLGGILGGTQTTTIPRSFALSAPPAGYQLAWDDGRLNPMRGIGTPQGEAQMRQVWTDTVPRTLASVQVQPGQIVLTRRQRAAQALAERTAAQTATQTEDRVARARLPLEAQIGTAAAPSNEVRVGSTHRHVLAGTFGSQSEAAAAYSRLAATGMPARVGQVSRQGAVLYVVMAGPYGDAQSLGQAVMQARVAGFPSAMTRN